MSRSASIAPDLGDEPDLRPRETTAVDAAANPTTSAGAKVLAAIPINNVDGVSGDSISISSDPASKRRRLSHATRSPHSLPLSTPLPSSSRPVTCGTTRAPPGVPPGVILPIDLPVVLSGIPHPHLTDSTATNCIRTTNRPISDRARISLESASTANNSKNDDEDYLVAFAAKNSVPWNGSLTWPSNDLSRRQKRLAEMPPQREVRVRAKAVLVLNDAIQHEAALAYTRGNVADRWCKRCAAGDGNFPMCVVVKGEMEGACANCHFGRKKGKCSLHKSRKSYPFVLYFVSFPSLFLIDELHHISSHVLILYRNRRSQP